LWLQVTQFSENNFDFQRLAGLGKIFNPPAGSVKQPYPAVPPEPLSA
jgi:hypothetical protein